MAHQKPKRLFRLVYKWHRYTGLCVAIIVLILAFTGIAINHTDTLKLDQQYISSAAILDWYGIQEPHDVVSFSTGKHWITQVDGQIYHNEKLLLANTSKLRGAIESDHSLSIAFPDTLVLLTTEGDVIEKINMIDMLRQDDLPSHLPHRDIHNIGSDQLGNIYIATDDNIYASDDDFLAWKKTDGSNVTWAKQTSLPEKLMKKISQHFRTHILPMERLLLDIHSGRFFGQLGVYFVDLASILFALLAISGPWIWIHHQLKSKRSRRLLRRLKQSQN